MGQLVTESLAKLIDTVQENVPWESLDQKTRAIIDEAIVRGEKALEAEGLEEEALKDTSGKKVGPWELGPRELAFDVNAFMGKLLNGIARDTMRTLKAFGGDLTDGNLICHCDGPEYLVQGVLEVLRDYGLVEFVSDDAIMWINITREGYAWIEEYC